LGSAGLPFLIYARLPKAHEATCEVLGAARDDQPRAALAKQGKTDEAGKMLAAIYNWFTEGFDTADLKDARALLDELKA
jgi:predicted ATPase